MHLETALLCYIQLFTCYSTRFKIILLSVVFQSADKLTVNYYDNICVIIIRYTSKNHLIFFSILKVERNILLPIPVSS